MTVILRKMRREALDLDRAQRHPDATASRQQVVRRGGLQPAEIASEHRLELALESHPPTRILGQGQGPAVDNEGAKIHSGRFGGSAGGGMSWNSIVGMWWINAVGSPGLPGSSCLGGAPARRRSSSGEL